MADRAALCAEMGHPGVTHNPTANKTWCICGAHVYPGRPDTVDRHLVAQIDRTHAARKAVDDMTAAINGTNQGALL